MSDARRRPDDEELAEDATQTSSGAWDEFTDRAEDEQRLDHGDSGTTTDGVSPFPDVDLLAGALDEAAEAITGDDDGDERRGAP